MEVSQPNADRKVNMEFSDAIRTILDEFRLLCAIPHGSGMEDEIAGHLESRLISLGGRVVRDKSGNLRGDFVLNNDLENAPLIVLQAHMDMVVAGDIPPEEAVVNAIEEKGILRSDGHTTLGADNGIGVATILSILRYYTEKKTPANCGPIRVIFTVSEEVGLRGAREIYPDWFRGVKYLINTDGFHSDTEVIGGKGGLRETFSRRIESEHLHDRVSFNTRKKNQIDETELYAVKLQGYLGGHSGDDIDKGRCNTICQLGEMLRDVQDHFDMRVADIEGGIGYNVIPAECSATVAVPIACRISAAKLLIHDEDILNRRLEHSDPTGKLTIEWLGETSEGDTLWEYNFQRDVLDFLTSITDGVEESDGDTVSSSCNLGRIFSENGVLYIGDMIRCDSKAQEDVILDEHRRVAQDNGFKVDVMGYHSWHSLKSGRLANLVAEIYEEHQGVPMERKNAKVGLEPAYFQMMAPDMEIVCLGAEIRNAHSVKEEVEINSIGLLYHLIKETLERLASSE